MAAARFFGEAVNVESRPPPPPPDARSKVKFASPPSGEAEKRSGASGARERRKRVGDPRVRVKVRLSKCGEEVKPAAAAADAASPAALLPPPLLSSSLLLLLLLAFGVLQRVAAVRR